MIRLRRMLTCLLIAMALLRMGMVQSDAEPAAPSNAEYVAMEQANPRLADADHALNAAYWKAYKQVSADGKRALRTAQLRWIRARDDNAAIAGPVGSPAYVDSLLMQTQARTATLDSLLAQTKLLPQGLAAPPASEPAHAASVTTPTSASIAAPAEQSRPSIASAPAPAVTASTSTVAIPARTAPAAAATPTVPPQGASATAAIAPPTAAANSHTAETFAWILIGSIIVFGMIGTIRGLGGKVVVYTNYTDAAVSSLGFWGGIVTALAMRGAAYGLHAGMLADASPYGFLFVLGASLILTMRASWSSNATIGAALLSIAAKLLISLAFIIYAIVYLTSEPNRRRGEKESEAAYAERIAREEVQSERTRVVMAVATALTTYLIHHLTSDRRWIPLGAYVRRQTDRA